MINLKMQTLLSNSMRFMPKQNIATQPVKLSVIRQEGAGFTPTNSSLTQSALSIYLAA